MAVGLGLQMLVRVHELFLKFPLSVSITSVVVLAGVHIALLVVAMTEFGVFLHAWTQLNLLPRARSLGIVLLGCLEQTLTVLMLRFAQIVVSLLLLTQIDSLLELISEILLAVVKEICSFVVPTMF